MITGSLVYTVAFHLLLVPLLVQEFHRLLTDLGADIPLLIRILAVPYRVPWLMWSSPIPAVLYVIGVLVLCGLCLRWLLRFSEYRVSLYLPYLREYLRLDAAANFCDTLAMLLGAQVPLPEAVRLAASSVPSGPLRHRLDGVADRVEQGEALGECLREARVFPPAVGWRLWSAYYGADFQAELAATAASCRHGLRPWEVRIQQSASVIAGAAVAVVLSPVALVIFALNDSIYAMIRHIG
jgi:type II secretory pathway component PulF